MDKVTNMTQGSGQTDGLSSFETVGFKPFDDCLDATSHLSERLGDWFPDDWLYSEDDITIDFHVHVDKSLANRKKKGAPGQP